MKKDYFGNELKIGDKVIFVSPCNSPNLFETGNIIEFTPKMCRIKYKKKGDLCLSYILKYSNTIVKL